MSEPKIEILDGPDDLARQAAEMIREAAAAAIRERGRFTLALSGGSTPEKAYKLLAADEEGRVDWSRCLLFFGDERFVPAGDPRGNLAMVQRSLLQGPPSAARCCRKPPAALWQCFFVGEPPPPPLASAPLDARHSWLLRWRR